MRTPCRTLSRKRSKRRRDNLTYARDAQSAPDWRLATRVLSVSKIRLVADHESSHRTHITHCCLDRWLRVGLPNLIRMAAGRVVHACIPCLISVGRSSLSKDCAVALSSAVCPPRDMQADDYTARETVWGPDRISIRCTLLCEHRIIVHRSTYREPPLPPSMLLQLSSPLLTPTIALRYKTGSTLPRGFYVGLPMIRDSLRVKHRFKHRSLTVRKARLHKVQ